MENKSLYDITLDYEAVREKALSCADEETGEIQEEFLNDLIAVEGLFRDKAVAYGKVMRELEAQEAYAAQEEAYYKAKKEKAAKRYEAMKNALSAACDKLGIDRIETPDCSISFRKSTSVDPFNEAAIPAEYWREVTTTKLDKAKVKQALQAGVQIDGARLVEKRNIQFN